MDTSNVNEPSSIPAIAPVPNGLLHGLAQQVCSNMMQRLAELQADRERHRNLGRVGPVETRKLREESAQLCNQALRFLELNKTNAHIDHRDGAAVHSESFGSDPNTALLFCALDQLDERELLTKLASARWPAGFSCGYCGGTFGRLVKSRRAICCATCGRFTSLFSGTPLAGSHVPIRIWVRIAWALLQRPAFSLDELARFAGLKRAGTVSRLKRKLSSLCASANVSSGPLTLDRLLQLLVCHELGRQAQSASAHRKEQPEEDHPS